MNSTQIVLSDSHIHLFAAPSVGTRHGMARNLAGDDVGGYEALRSLHAIDIALVVGYQGDVSHRGNNAFVLARAQEHQWIRPLAYVDPSATASQVEDMMMRGYCGVSVYATRAEDASEVRDLLMRVAPPLIERRALLSINVIPDVYPAIALAVETWPELRILISHLGLPAAGARGPADAEAALLELRHLSGPHSYIKASGFYALGSTVAAEDALTRVLDKFGVNRVIWGSDYPPVLDHQSFARAVDGPWRRLLPVDSISKVMGGTLRELLADVERTVR